MLAMVREAVRRLHLGWVGLPPEARRRWWRTLGFGFALTALLDVALVAAMRALDERAALRWDDSALVFVVERLPLSFSTAMWLEGPGNGFVLWVLVLLSAGVAAWRGKPLLAIAFLLGQTLIYVHLAIPWSLWGRPRPELVAGGIAAPDEIFQAFPSGHVMQTVFPLGMLTWIWMERSARVSERIFAVACLIVVLTAVGFGRLRVGAHWPSDIIGGVLLGGAWLVAVLVALRRAEAAAKILPGSSDTRRYPAAPAELDR